MQSSHALTFVSRRAPLALCFHISLRTFVENSKHGKSRLGRLWALSVLLEMQELLAAM